MSHPLPLPARSRSRFLFLFAVAYALLVGLAGLVILAPVGGDGADLWFHLATGDWILLHGRIPLEDPFAHTTAGKELVVHGWLADVALSWVHRVAGFGGLRAFQAVLIAAAVLAWGVLLRRLGWARSLSAALPLLALALFADRVRLRPDLASFLMFPAFLVLLERWHVAARVRCAPALGAVALVALWANLHPAVLLSPVLAGALWLGHLLRRRRLGSAGAREDVPGAGLPLAAALLLVLATFCNPYGPKLYVYALSVGRDVGPLVGEWKSSLAYWAFPTHLGHALAPFVVSGLLLASMVRADARDGSRSWLLVGLIGLVYAFSNGRFLYLLFVPLATGLPRDWRRPKSLAVAGAVTVCAFAMLALARGPFIQFVLQNPGVSLRPGPYPSGAVGFLQSLPEPALRLWHVWNWGGYIAFRTGGSVKTFADGRLVLYGANLLVDQQAMIEATQRMEKEEFLARHGVEALVVAPDTWPRGGPWFRIWSSDQSEVFLHRARARKHLRSALNRYQARGVKVLGVDRAAAEDAIAADWTGS